MDDRDLFRALEAERKLKVVLELLEQAHNELLNEQRIEFIEDQDVVLEREEIYLDKEL